MIYLVIIILAFVIFLFNYMNKKRIEREDEKKERLAEKQENLLNILKKDKNDTAIKE